MRSAFYGINIATQGLYTARTALDVTNHNISNAETPGYSRQYAVQVASRPYPNAGKGMIGSGSEVINIARYRDSYLDTKYWNFITDLGHYDTKYTQLEQLEYIFNEPSDSGLITQFNNFMESMQQLSTDASLGTKKTNFIDMANAFTEHINDVAKQMRMYQRDANFGIKNKVEQINFLAKQLASVNDQIANLELTGSHANDLRDERIKLIDELSKVVNTKVTETEDVNGKKNTTIYINGQVLVDGNHANFLEVRTRNSLHNPEDELDLYDVYWENGRVFDLTDPKLKGELKGYVDLRDGNNGQNFTGTIAPVPAAPTNTITVTNPSRTDIPPKGELVVDGTVIEYTSWTYNTGTNEFTFNLATNCPAGATDVQIGEDMSFKGIPYYMNKLNEFVRTIALELNKIHKTGNGGTAGELFTYKGFAGGLDEAQVHTYDAITIDNFMVSQDIQDDINKLATTADPDLGPSANDVILAMLEIRHNNNVFDKGEPQNFLQALIGELGIDSKQSKSVKEGQTNLSNLIDNQRISYSGVDINEEANNMVRFQHAYSLAAKMISVMDEIYDVTINRMGV